MTCVRRGQIMLISGGQIMLVATLLMSKARLREPIKLSPGGFQTSCPYQPERQFPRNLGKKTPPVSGRRSTSRRRYGGRSPESMLIRSLLRHSLSNQLGRGQKKTPPVSGWRSNYAHLTEVSLQDLCHRNVKEFRGSPGREASDSGPDVQVPAARIHQAVPQGIPDELALPV